LIENINNKEVEMKLALANGNSTTKGIFLRRAK